MKRLAGLIFGCLLGLAAQAQSDITIQVAYTTGAASVATSSGKTVPGMVADCLAVTNPSYAAQGINVRILPIVLPAGSSAKPDSASMLTQFVWAQSSVASLQARTNAGASMSIVVSAPGPTVSGVIPLNPPTIPKDAVGAVNVAQLCAQLEDAISRNLGSSLSQGVASRKRTFPYQGTGNLCFHTRDRGPSDPAAEVPYDPYWGNADRPIIAAATPAQACTNVQTYTTGVASVTLTPVGDGSVQWSCNTFRADGSSNGIVPITHFYPSGTSTVTCAAGDAQLTSYSKTGGTYSGYPTGDATHDNVAAMNGRVSMVLGFPSNNATLLAQAQAAVSWIASVLHLD